VITVTIRELREQRARYDKMTATVAALRELGFTVSADSVERAAETLGGQELGVLLPCLLCKTPEPIPVQVGDPSRSEPGSFICAPCSAKVDAAVAAARQAAGGAG
jgi:hypothetical protein